MRPVWLLAVSAFGCRAILGIDEPLAADATLDAPGSCTAWHPQGFEPCALGAPLPALHLTAAAYIYDTTDGGGQLIELLPDTSQRVVLTSPLTVGSTDHPGDRSIAVLSVDQLTIDAAAALRVVGPRPLLIVAWSTIAVSGSVDASSHAGLRPLGAGANVACAADDTGKDGAGVADATGGSGGGGGGGWRGMGGSGGAGKAMTMSGGGGGSAAAVPAVRGGCAGGASGSAGTIASSPSTKDSQARGGAGGGAIRLVAHDSIMLSGSISAGGAGGDGAPLRSACGGGGGGSGGYVGFEAPSVTISGTVAANGGGGGGGGGSGNAGNPGGDGAASDQAAPGGAVTEDLCGQTGGAGSARSPLGGLPGFSFAMSCLQTGGGGGGGGGAGFIVITTNPGFVPGPSATLSPPALLQ